MSPAERQATQEVRRLEADLKDMSGVLCETMAKEATFRLGCRSLIMTQQLARSQAALEHTPSGRLEKREANIQQREADLRHTDREQKKAKKTEKEEVKDNRLLVEKLFDKNFKPLPKWCYKGFRFRDERTYLVEEAEDITSLEPGDVQLLRDCLAAMFNKSRDCFDRLTKDHLGPDGKYCDAKLAADAALKETVWYPSDKPQMRTRFRYPRPSGVHHPQLFPYDVVSSDGCQVQLRLQVGSRAKRPVPTGHPRTSPLVSLPRQATSPLQQENPRRTTGNHHGQGAGKPTR